MVHPLDPDTKPVDPIEQRRAVRAAAQVEVAKPKSTFKTCAREYIALQRPAWGNPKHAMQWDSTLSTYAYPVFGDLPVDVVDTGLVLQALEPIWTTKTETASRVRQRIEAVLNYAKVKQLRNGENPARWRGHLDNVLPSPSEVSPVKHFRALHYNDVGEFMHKLRLQNGVAARALEFGALTVMRIGSVRKARKTEIHLAERVWTVPPVHLKKRKGREIQPLRVPLSPSALAIANQMMADYPDSEYLFPGDVPGKPLSDNATRALLIRMAYNAATTTHGFRSTFKDWAHEVCEPHFPDDVIETAMAHVIGNTVRAAYQRGDLFERRRELMDAWARYCAPPAANVVQMKNRTAAG
jgi:integrase